MGKHFIQPRDDGPCYLSLRVPTALYRAGWHPPGKAKPVTHIIEKLEITDGRSARDVAEDRRRYWKEQFERIRSGAALSNRDIQDAAERAARVMRVHLEDSAEVMRDVFKDRARTPQLAEVKWLEALLEGLPEALAADDFARALEDVKEVEQTYRINPPLEPGSDTHTKLCRALLRAKVAALTNRVKWLKGEPQDAPGSYLAGDEFDSAGRKQKDQRPGRRAEKGPLTLFEAWKEKRQPAADTARDWRRVFVSLDDKFGQREIAPADAQTWANELVTPERSAATVHKTWLNAAKTVYGWAARQHPPLASNSFAAVTVTVPRKIETRESRAFSSDEWRTILQAASAIEVRSSWDAARHWIPWLLAYSGARVGELTQLRSQDVRIEDGIAYMLLTPEAGTIKMGKARRVPLHKDLLAQGFLNFVKSRGKGPLFFDAKRKGSTDRRRAVKLRERLAGWVRELGVNDKGISPNHAWRHLFKNIAGSEDVAITERMSDAITGHSQKSVGRSYGAPTLKDLARAMAKFPRFEV